MVWKKCQTDSAHRSHRVGLKEHLAGMVGYYPYRCRKCGDRFRVHGRGEAEPASSAVRSTEREIAYTQGSRRRKVVRRAVMLYGCALVLFGVILYYLTREPSMGG